MEQITFKAMGSEMMAALASHDERGAHIVRQVPRWFATWEETLSRFRPDSELSKLNRRAGRPMRVSRTLWRVIKAAQKSAEDSDGLVVATALSALESVGYDRDFASLAAGGNPALGAAPVVVAPSSAIVANERTRTVRLIAGTRLDLGGVAKGWAADAALRRLSVHAPALVDAGGDIAVGDPPDDLPGWPVGVADPFRPGQQLTLLRVSNQGVATSGRDYRRWQSGGTWQHHIIDPRTGKPAETDVLSATVVAPSTREAEAAAKTVLILGSTRGVEWLDSRPSLAGLIVREAGDVIPSSRLEQFVWR